MSNTRGNSLFQTAGFRGKEPLGYDEFSKLYDTAGNTWDLLGQGGYGTVLTAIKRVHGGSVRVVLKFIRLNLKSAEDVKSALFELVITQYAPGILNSTNAMLFEGDANGPFLMLEFPRMSIDLANFLRDQRESTPSITETWRIFKGVAEGVVKLHMLNIAHNDIKPANVLIDPSGAVLADCSIARPSQVPFGCPCTVPFRPIEKFLGRRLDKKLWGEASKQSDIWALGCVVATMVGLGRGKGISPFPDRWDVKETILSHCKTVGRPSEEEYMLELCGRLGASPAFSTEIAEILRSRPEELELPEAFRAKVQNVDEEWMLEELSMALNGCLRLDPDARFTAFNLVDNEFMSLGDPTLYSVAREKFSDWCARGEAQFKDPQRHLDSILEMMREI